MIRRRPDSTLKSFLKNTVSAQLHFLGFLAAIVGLVTLLHATQGKLDPKHFWSCLIYGITAIFVFAVSSLYHFLHDGFHMEDKLQKWFEDMDHLAIYLFIAGTYTPFIINVIKEPWKTTLLYAIWGLSFAGIIYTFFKKKLPLWAQHRFLYTSIFVSFGWALLWRSHEIFVALSGKGLWLLVAGGLSYSLGAVVYATERPKLIEGFFGSHEAWHLAVLAGFAFHFSLIFSFYSS